MTTIPPMWRIATLALVLSVRLANAEQAQVPPPPPPPPAPAPSGHDAQGGGGNEVRGNFVKMLTLVLNLTAEQQAKINVVFDDARGKAKAIGDSTTLSQDEKKAKIQELREATNAKIRPLLTPDQQKNFDELMVQLRQGTGGSLPAPVPK